MKEFKNKNVCQSKKPIFIFGILSIIVLMSCSTAKDYNTMDVDDLFKAGKERFEDEDWLEAQKIFDLIKLQHPTSKYADDAQYYMAESYFHQHKYILAASNYNSLRRYYPTSEYSKVSLFKTGMCFNELSLPFDRDQEYTNQAINAFTEFKYAYAGDSLASEANKRIKDLRNKLANREFFTAEIYRKLYSPQSALIYYDVVINEYTDTDFYQRAFVEKIKVLNEMQRYDEAIGIAQLYNLKFSKGEYASTVKDLEKTALEQKKLMEKAE